MVFGELNKGSAKMKHLLTALAATGAALSLSAVSTSASASVIFSDSFESPQVNSWQVFQSGVGDNGDWTAVAGAGIEIQNDSIVGFDAFDGEQFVELDSDRSRGGVAGPTNSSMATNVAFKTGQEYEVSFAYRPRTRTANDNVIELFAVDFDGNSINSGTLLTSVSETTLTLSDWTVITATFVATSTMNGLQFAASGISNSLGGYIDAVTVSEVPLPAGLPLFLAGLAGLTFARGGRKQEAA